MMRQGRRQPAKNGVESSKHFFNALGCVVSHVRARAKGLHARALENHEIGFGQGAFKRRIQRFHHGDVQNVQRRAIEGDPSGTMFDAELDSFAVSCHSRWTES